MKIALELSESQINFLACKYTDFARIVVDQNPGFDFNLGDFEKNQILAKYEEFLRAQRKIGLSKQKENSFGFNLKIFLIKQLRNEASFKPKDCWVINKKYSPENYHHLPVDTPSLAAAKRMVEDIIENKIFLT